MATNRPGDQGEASSIPSRPRNEPLRSHEDRADRMTPPCSPNTNASPQTFKCWQDGIQDSEVEDFIYQPPPTLRSQLFTPGDAECGAWSSPSGPKCPASFGDRGTTATAGVFGQLVQFSTYLGAGNSGMFSAGHSWVRSPYWVADRAEDLLSHASESFEEAQGEAYRTRSVFGLRFLNLKPSLTGCPRPRLEWFQYRWPRYEYEEQCFNGIMENVQLTIQFIIRNQTVYQQCILENRGNTDVTLRMAFLKGLTIDDLDHVTDDYDFNQNISDQQNAGPGPGGFSWVHVNRFSELSSGAPTESRHSSYDDISNQSHFNGDKNKSDFGVAVVTSMAVNGEMMRFCPGASPHIWEEDLSAKSKLEIVTAYELVLLDNPSREWKEFVVPLRRMNVNHFLRETKAVLLFRNPLTRISRKDSLHVENNKRDSGSLKRDDGEIAGGILNAPQDGMPVGESQPENQPLPAVDHESTLKKTSPITDHIEFTVRRNVQHILDVCAIPVAVHSSGHDSGGLVGKRLSGVQAIALSCGDLSGHRICTTSSFFAFQFLAEVAKRLTCLPQPGRDDAQVQKLLSRIYEVCLGHLKWLYAVQNNDQSKEGFGSLFWVTGEAVTLPESSDSWAPSDHPRDTAFQILKAMEFANTFAENKDDDPALVSHLIRQWGRGWLRWLERNDKREIFTWCHHEDRGLQVFRLDDQVWIWRALKAMEDERYGAWEILDDGEQHSDRDSSFGSEARNAHRMSRTTRRFASWMIEREALPKFTTHHEIVQKKMVALTRSPQETRFLFHDRDTALLYGEDLGFFPEDAELRQAWKYTIDVQRFHEDNQEARWDNPLRYALSIMLGTRGHQINSRKPEHMVRVATEVLLRSSSQNGLFPGKLDIAAKSPLNGVFYWDQDADSFYKASFEIPYIFLTHSEAIEDMMFPKPFHPGPRAEISSWDAIFSLDPSFLSPTSPEANAAHYTSNPQMQSNQRKEGYLRESVKKSSDNQKLLSHFPNLTSSSDSTRTEEISGDPQLTLKKTVPFSNIIDSHNIVEIEDEWLFNYPEFFGSKCDDCISIDDTLDSVANSDATWLKSIDVARMRVKYSSFQENDGSADNRSTASSNGSSSSSSYSESSISSVNSIEWGDPGDSGLKMSDIASRKRLHARKGYNYSERSRLGSFEYMWKQMRRPRTATEAKKRVIVWDRPNADLEVEAALLCYSASKGYEKKNMFEFFERHFRRENFIFDHCNLTHNTWETEVHLSFFILRDAPRLLYDDAPLDFERFPGVRGKRISRVSMGIRFDGDMFDRYWTLHLFSNVELRELREKRMADISGRLTLEESLKSQQRKVLELYLMDILLFHIESWTQTILAEVKSEMGIKSGAFSWSIPSMDTYSSWHRTWEGFAPLLQALANDLVSAQDIVGQWETRESGRGQERPRWTRNDEKKYRPSITRGQRMIEWRKKGLQDALRDVKSLQEACTTRLANAREELQFRSNQNIASFTYVTIVFLPLGFAASVFSMNGYPDTSWVVSMTVIAVVTLAITATALANAKLLLGVAQQLSKNTAKFTETAFQSSFIGQQHQSRRDERVQSSTEPNEPSNGDPKASQPLDGRTMRHVLFWMAYLLIELPARRVALVCRELPAFSRQASGSLRPNARPAEPVGSTDGTSTDGLPTTSAASTFRRGMRIVVGILLLPLLFVSWMIQLLFYNVLDILVCLGRLIKKTFNALVTLSDAKGSASNTKILTWLLDPPSSLRPMQNVMSHDQKNEDSSEQVDTGVASDRSDTGPNEEV